MLKQQKSVVFICPRLETFTGFFIDEYIGCLSIDEEDKTLRFNAHVQKKLNKWKIKIMSAVWSHMTAKSKWWGAESIANLARNPFCYWDRGRSSVSTLTGCCKALPAVVFEVSNSASYRRSPAVSVRWGCFQFLRVNSCPFEVGFQVVLVSLPWAALLTVARYQLTIEDLAWDPSLTNT